MLVLRQEAEEEATAARLYYEKDSDEAARNFLMELRKVLDQIDNAPMRYRVYDSEFNIRICLLRKFPYYVLYRVERDIAEVIAVCHSSREPNYWKNRLD
ncbi:type II toxin-antitoxin system RelE/ParE family toxin [Calycomorphotria hydatis]|uniref:Plasmid stabilization system protein n=1 Tax=Calycomorphotria hydatis TaxID=2528027 RepID=A0A517T7G4_9PLAN|nr:type II toxin-antitoxin system RelE/ParE family toxin [Calycomorphotria hydatis]QDT64315.1 Plasmid stabilization system protein [Calycomorphotria hydatis]